MEYECPIRGVEGQYISWTVIGGVVETDQCRFLLPPCDLKPDIIFADLLRQRNDQPEPGRFRRVLMGGVETACSHRGVDLCPNIRRGVIHIQT